MSSDASSDSQSEGSGIKGMYMYGGVGCGKTMIMDLLVSSAPQEFKVRSHLSCECHRSVSNLRL